MRSAGEGIGRALAGRRRVVRRAQVVPAGAGAQEEGIEGEGERRERGLRRTALTDERGPAAR